MSRLFLTGDTHQSIDIHKLSSSKFKIGNELTKDDILIITGDAGFVWNYGKSAKGEEKYWRNWINNRSWTTFCVCGNHENYDLINEFPIVDFFGGKARKITDSLYYEIRGEVYNINGRKILACGGADSTDKEFRKEGVSWWAKERISSEDYKNALKNLEKYNFNIDYIITHTGGTEICSSIGFNSTVSDIYIDQIIKLVNFKQHYCGHYHVDKSFLDIKSRIIYNDIIELM